MGNSEIKFCAIDDFNINCGIKANKFENSGIYYFEKINCLGERERLYQLPSIEVKFLFDK